MSKTVLGINGGSPARKKFLPYGHQWIDEDDIKAVADVLRSDWITQGQKVTEFEELVAAYCNVKYAVAFSSGTAALHGAVYASGISNGDEVITTPVTFVADGNCVLFMGGSVIFADVKSDTYNIDPEKILEKITKRTKAIVSVDYTGQPCDIDRINTIAEEHNLVVIQDAAHSIGSMFKGKRIGSLSDMTVFSFHPVKAITTGEGGMVTTNNSEYREKLIRFRGHGIVRGDDWQYEMRSLGYNYRITDFQCVLGISQFKKLESFIERRRRISKIYNEAFASIPELVTPYEKKDVRSAYHLYMIQLNLERLRVGRKKIFEAIRAENIGVHVHYIPLHLQPYYQETFGYKKGDFPVAEGYYERALTLPVFPRMNDADVADVISSVKKVIEHYRVEGGFVNE